MDVRLERQMWRIGDRLGGGGFGQVYEAQGPDGVDRVAKLVPKEPGAERELLFGDALNAAASPNVVPVVDRGETDDAWVIIMPRAEKSLRQHLEAHGEPTLELGEIAEILSHVAAALAHLAGEIVHRDIKPENVLLLDGSWCLADFGISRYAAATTGANTRKFSLTPAYGSPEQWRGERATSASDVYALGAMAYELLAGHPPFPGPDVEDFREQHLQETPAPLASGTGRLRTLIEECLYKEPAARPTPSNLLARLERARDEPRSVGATRLAQANQAVAQRAAQSHIEEASRRETLLRRSRIASDGERAYAAFVLPMLEAIESDAPAAKVARGEGNGTMAFVARLGDGTLGMSNPAPVGEWEGPFSVVASAVLTVRRQDANQFGWTGRSHSLWFCDAFEADRFSWCELAFMESPFSGDRPSFEPYAGEPDQVGIAFSNVMGTMQLAWGLDELDRDDPAELIDRWLGWFADAVEGRLHRPSSMPERRGERAWRRG